MLLEPTNLLALLLLAGCMLLAATRWRRAGTGLVMAATVILFGFIFLPLDAWLAAPIEQTVPPSILPAQVDGILVMGGNPARTIAGAALARRFPNAVLLFSGGGANLLAPDINQAHEAASLYRGLGLAPPRLLLEDRSVTTYDSLIRAKAMAARVPGTWLLVTSAIHMPRALGVARKLGWNVVPYSSDYISQFSGKAPPPSFSAAQKMNDAAKALHEYIGLWIYRRENRI